MAAEESENRYQGRLKRQRKQGNVERTPLQVRDLNQRYQAPQDSAAIPSPQDSVAIQQQPASPALPAPPASPAPPTPPAPPAPPAPPTPPTPPPPIPAPPIPAPPVAPIPYAARQHLPPHFSVVHHLKPFTAKCSKCNAKHWLEERSRSPIQNAKFSMCCALGKVKLPAPVYPPLELEKYLLDQTRGVPIIFFTCFVSIMANLLLLLQLARISEITSGHTTMFFLSVRSALRLINQSGGQWGYIPFASRVLYATRLAPCSLRKGTNQGFHRSTLRIPTLGNKSANDSNTAMVTLTKESCKSSKQ